MGGISMALAVEAAQTALDMSLLWIEGQFHAPAAPGATLTVDVEIPVRGRRAAQASVTVRDGNRTILAALAGLGVKGESMTQSFIPPPACLSVRDAEPRPPEPTNAPGGLLDLVEQRLALIDEDRGRSQVWRRLPDFGDAPPALLAVLADFVGGGHSRTHRCRSLDNMLRIHAQAATDWVLCDTQLLSFRETAFHGRMHLFAEDGTLLATAEQTALFPSPARQAQPFTAR
jgi:acyl-CoA thioesterase